MLPCLPGTSTGDPSEGGSSSGITCPVSRGGLLGFCCVGRRGATNLAIVHGFSPSFDWSGISSSVGGVVRPLPLPGCARTSASSSPSLSAPSPADISTDHVCTKGAVLAVDGLLLLLLNGVTGWFLWDPVPGPFPCVVSA